MITSSDKKKIGRAIFHSGKLSNWTISFEADGDYLNKNANIINQSEWWNTYMAPGSFCGNPSAWCACA